MPLVRIEIQSGHTREYKNTLLQAVHDGLVTALQIPEDDRHQRLYELAPEDFLNPGKTERLTVIELTLFPGRSREMKRAAVAEITRLLGERLDIEPSDVFITITEPPLDNWGLLGQLASNLGFEYKK